MTASLSAASAPLQPQVDGAEATLSPNLLLIALPTAIGFATIHVSAAFVALVAIAMAGLVFAQRTAGRIRLTVPSLILPAVGLAVAFRPNPPATSTGAILYLASCAALAVAVAVSLSRDSAFVSLVDGIGLLLVAAVALSVVGFGPSTASSAGGNLFTGGARTLFPLTGSLASGPALAAAYLVAAIPITWRTRKHIALRMVCAMSAIWVLIQGDRRSALLAAVVLLVSTIVAPRIFRLIAPWVIGTLLLAPVWLKVTGLSASQVQWSFLLRPGEESGATFNARVTIWSRALDFFQIRVDPFHQALGFGTSGQAASGASVTYRSVFSGGFSERGQSANSPHNSVLQSLFDTGWIGASVFFVMVICLAWTLSRTPGIFALGGLAMLTALSFVGTTESVMAPGYSQPVFFTVAALSVIGFAKEEPPEGQVIRS